MLNFLCFGSGSSGNCYYLYTETEGILIDAGIGTRTLKKYFADYGLSMSSIKAILITHDHADHVKSVGSLSSDLCLPVYSTSAVHHGIEENFCVRKKIRPGYERYIEHDETFCIGDMVITCFHVPHDSSDNVGYRIIHDGVTFCLITDAGCVTDAMKPFITEANYLVLEANYEPGELERGPYPEHLKRRIVSGTGHLSNELCGQAIAENASPNLRHVWLAHLSEQNNHPELAMKTVETVLRKYGIIAGKDFKLDYLKRRRPSEVHHLT